MYRYSNVFITLLASTMIVNALMCIQVCAIITKMKKGVWFCGWAVEEAKAMCYMLDIVEGQFLYPK